MTAIEISINVEDLAVGDEIISRTIWSFDCGTQVVSGSWIVGSVHWMAADRLADVYTDRGLLGFRRGDKVTVRRETVDEQPNETSQGALMDTFELATVVVAGTALVLAPIDPQPIRDLNTPVPASTWVVTFDEKKVRLVRDALGFRNGWTPSTHLGETLTYITAWTQHELNDLYVRVGGTVTTRPVVRTACDGDATWSATEITLTVPVPGVGDVQIVTDWDEESGGHNLPIMQAIPDAVLIAA